MEWRSKEVLVRPNGSMNRSLIGIANSWNRVVPGHYHLDLVSDYVKQGIHQAGGTPVEFGVIAPCDGIAQATTAYTSSSLPGT